MFGLVMRKLQQRGRRMMTFAVVACWLLLNAQLALAAHLCDMPVMVHSTSTATHHGATSSMSHAAHISTMAKTPLCDKHCTPDNAQKTTSQLHLDAIAHDSGMQLVVATPALTPDEQNWLTPPRTGPPTEIVYCRFRE